MEPKLKDLAKDRQSGLRLPVDEEEQEYEQELVWLGKCFISLLLAIFALCAVYAVGPGIEARDTGYGVNTEDV